MKRAVHARHASVLTLSWSCTHQVELWTTEVEKTFSFISPRPGVLPKKILTAENQSV